MHSVLDSSPPRYMVTLQKATGFTRKTRRVDVDGFDHVPRAKLHEQYISISMQRNTKATLSSGNAALGLRIPRRQRLPYRDTPPLACVKRGFCTNTPPAGSPSRPWEPDGIGIVRRL